MNKEMEEFQVRVGEAHEEVYEPKFENVDNKTLEERRRIFKMIDEGGPVFLDKILKRKSKK